MYDFRDIHKYYNAGWELFYAIYLLLLIFVLSWFTSMYTWSKLQTRRIKSYLSVLHLTVARAKWHLYQLWVVIGSIAGRSSMGDSGHERLLRPWSAGAGALTAPRQLLVPGRGAHHAVSYWRYEVIRVVQLYEDHNTLWCGSKMLMRWPCPISQCRFAIYL